MRFSSLFFYIDKLYPLLTNNSNLVKKILVFDGDFARLKYKYIRCYDVNSRWNATKISKYVLFLKFLLSKI